MINTVSAPNVPGRGCKPGIAGKYEGYKSIVQVNYWQQGIERGFGKRSLRSCSGCGWRFSCKRADKIHEKLGKLLEVKWIIYSQRTYTLFGRVVTTSRKHRVYRYVQRFVQRQQTRNPHTYLCDIFVPWVYNVVPCLKVPYILCWFSIYKPGIGRRYEILPGCTLGNLRNHIPHRVGKEVKIDYILHHVLGIFGSKGLEIGNKSIGRR
ncbi:hypothetical protein SDC9_111036 [bioreactor metagenome]|uniref:Uncharacterized protein n=1 Tax=bioreactor metagenome TaxID=1076179 RepID=A0A645BFC1_9ZZZZ